MTTAVTAAVAFAAAAGTASLATPVAIAVARRTDFYDRPREYREHKAATPFLGGAAVLCGWVLAALVTGALVGHLPVVLAFAVGMWVLGTIDDRRNVSPFLRVCFEALAAGGLIVAGLGWPASSGGAAADVLSVIWVVGLVNAFNLMDNLDGACSTVGGVSAAGIGILAALHGQPKLAALALGLSGACAGFLPWNLAGPAKVFLGDGGSMTIGFVIAALAMAAGRDLRIGDNAVLVGALLAGLPILDTALVCVSRFRRRVSLLTGGRDHLTHRLLLLMRSPRAVATALASCQALLCTAAILSADSGVGAIRGCAAGAVILGVGAIAALDRGRWRPPGTSVEPRPVPAAVQLRQTDR